MLIFNMTLLTSIQISFQSTNTNKVHRKEMGFVHEGKYVLGVWIWDVHVNLSVVTFRNGLYLWINSIPKHIHLPFQHHQTCVYLYCSSNVRVLFLNYNKCWKDDDNQRQYQIKKLHILYFHPRHNKVNGSCYYLRPLLTLTFHTVCLQSS